MSQSRGNQNRINRVKDGQNTIDNKELSIISSVEHGWLKKGLLLRVILGVLLWSSPTSRTSRHRQWRSDRGLNRWYDGHRLEITCRLLLLLWRVQVTEQVFWLVIQKRWPAKKRLNSIRQKIKTGHLCQRITKMTSRKNSYARSITINSSLLVMS